MSKTKDEPERSQIGEILADFEQDHDEEKAVRAIQKELADQDRISREDERKKILAKLPKIKEPTIHEAVCDDSECMIRKQNYKGFNECLKEIKQLIIC